MVSLKFRILNNLLCQTLPVVVFTLGLDSCVVVPPPIESHYNQAVDLYDQGKFSDAVEHYKLALRGKPGDYFATYNLAVVYQDQGKMEKAEALYQDILEDSEDTNSRINLAAIYEKQGREDLALEQLRKAVSGNIDSPQPSSVLGEYFERKGRLDEVEGLYKEALQIDEKHAVSHFRLGRFYLAQGKHIEGEKHILKAIDLEPEQPEYLERLADEYERQGRLLQATALLERVSAIHPDRPEIYVRLGDFYRQKKYYEKAVVRYWEALSLNDQNLSVHQNLKKIFEILTQREIENLKKLKKHSTVARTE